MRLWSAVFFVTAGIVVAAALPPSLVADAEVASTKVKRAEEVMTVGNQQSKPARAGLFYANIKKRAVRSEETLPSVFLTTEAPPSDAAGELQGQRRGITHARTDVDMLANLRNKAAMDKDENSKTAAQYEKGYLYGVGKEALDKHAENTLLKSEIYGEPINEYRYYGGGDAHREEKIVPKKQSLFPAVDNGARLKRDLELDPESLLALISLWQAQRNSYPNYRDRSDYSRYGYDRADDNDVPIDDDEEDVDNEEWMSNPVPLSRYQYDVGNQYNQYPVADRYGMVDNYPSVKTVYYPPLGRVEHKRAQWSGYMPEKRFMVSKRRQYDRWEEPSVWARLLATQPRDPMPGLIPHRRVLL